jgi:hypothetical protein
LRRILFQDEREMKMNERRKKKMMMMTCMYLSNKNPKELKKRKERKSNMTKNHENQILKLILSEPERRKRKLQNK